MYGLEASENQLHEQEEEYMKKCITLAYQAKTRGNYPFAAILVKDNKILYISENTEKTDFDPTSHAVVNLIQNASRKMTPCELRQCTIYCSSEPCPLCASAIYFSSIPKVVYGCPAETLKKKTGESFFIPCREILSRGSRPTEVVGPVLGEFAAYVHEDFWQRKK